MFSLIAIIKKVEANRLLIGLVALYIINDHDVTSTRVLVLST